MERKPTKNDALEALDFIINVLKEHEKDLDRLISQLGIITESLGETGELTGKIEKIEDRITSLQGDITDMMQHVATPKDTPPRTKTATAKTTTTASSVTINCKQWDDFKTMAAGAETVSYMFKEAEGGFQADALAKGRIVSYTGEFPQNSVLLKMWLSRELQVAEEAVFEGCLSIR
jgi:hypothetical protein